MDALEVRLRCIEAAARNPTPHADGFAAGVLETARQWAGWVSTGGSTPPDTREVLGLPKKKQ